MMHARASDYISTFDEEMKPQLKLDMCPKSVYG